MLVYAGIIFFVTLVLGVSLHLDGGLALRTEAPVILRIYLILEVFLCLWFSLIWAIIQAVRTA